MDLSDGPFSKISDGPFSKISVNLFKSFGKVLEKTENLWESFKLYKENKDETFYV